MKKMIALLLALIMVFSLVACSGSADTAKDTTTTDSTTTDTTGSDTTAEPASTEGSVINVCLASEPDTIDPALNSAVDGATMLAHLFSGLAKWSQDADGNLQIVADAATELPEGVENEDGTVTYTYTLRDGLVWSDGQPVTAGDFAFAWQRAASPELAADYGYMFEVVDGYADIWATDDDGNFLWPGFGDNMRVLDWIVDRCEGKVDAQETAIGYLPYAKDINRDGLDMTEEQLDKILDVDKDAWEEELKGVEELYAKFGDHLPKELADELATVKANLEK